MEHTLPRPLDWRPFAWAALWTVNAIALAITIAAFFLADVAVDWNIFTEAGRRFFEGGLYEWEGLPWRYSPLLAPVFVVLAPFGYLGWSALHFGALLTLPRKLALLLLISAPFWNDVYNGNTVTFAFVAAWWALTGSRVGTVAFLVLAVLIPRPMMLPVLAYLLWTRREWVVPFLCIAVGSLLGAWMTGWLDEWVLAEIANVGRSGLKNDFGPAVLIGGWWYPIGFVLAAWFTVKGRLGIASLMAAMYWTVTYPMMLFLDALDHHDHRSRNRA